MKKGYPAQEYYGKPADLIEEVDSKALVENGKAENVDADSGYKVSKAKTPPSPVKTRDYAMEASELRESFEKKIDFITDLWRQIENPEVANLPLVEFRRRMLGLLNNLERVVPNSSGLISESERRMVEISKVSLAIGYEKNKRRIEGSSSTGNIDILEARINNLTAELNVKLGDPNFEFVHHCVAFVAGIFLKKTNIDSLREFPAQVDKLIAGSLFCDRLSSIKFESKYGQNSRSYISSNQNLRRLIHFLRQKIAAGKNIFDYIEINPYDIVFTLDRKDFDEINIDEHDIQDDDKNKKKSITFGIHFINTSIIMIATGDKDRAPKDIERTKVHERGHNIAEIAGKLEGLSIHNTIYSKKFINGLRSTGLAFKNHYENGDTNSARTIAVDYMKTAIYKLNGEISADARNIVQGYPKALINYMLDLIDSLGEYIADSRSQSSSDIEEEEVKDAFLQIVESEIANLKIKALDLVVKIVTYAHIARKYGLEDEFCSALVLMPDSEKYLKRLFSIKLGDKFDFVSANREINSDEIFSDASYWLRADARKYFGPNSIAVE